MAREAPSSPGHVDRARAAAAKQLRARIKKKARLEANVRADVQRLESLALEGRRGELMKTALGRISRGQADVRVEDWETGEEVVLELRPELGPAENLRRFFDRGKRGQRGLDVAKARLHEVEVERRRLEDELRTLESPEGASVLPRVAPDEGLLEKAAARAKALPIDKWARRFVAGDGTEIRVGKGAKENDHLTLRGSRAQDLWLHARGVPGAHVVLRVEAGREPHPEAILDAAHLAVHYSGLQKERRADVIVTEVRFVKKTKGAPPGQVGVSKSRTLHVAMEEERLRRLFQGSGVEGT
ncbi:MAG: DUF814 domain-containing protein [Myxococcales bacterium]|nr:DUF814 domain-containing protein [Myxococcales bacterium]